MSDGTKLDPVLTIVFIVVVISLMAGIGNGSVAETTVVPDFWFA